MPRYINVDVLWRDITSNIEYCGDVLEIIERQPVVTINDHSKEIIVTNCNHLADHSKMVSSSWPYENGKDIIYRQDAIDALNEYFARIGKLKRRGLTEGEKAISLDTVGTIKTLPSAQPEIIHCRECKHWREGDAYSYCDKLFSMGVLDVYDYMTSEDDFCSNAERRTDAETEV